MSEIWKYPVLTGFFEHDMPEGSEILDVQMQNGRPVMWALVEPTREKHTRSFFVVGTGRAFDDDDVCRYVGSFQTVDGMFVFHLFEK